MDVTIRFLAKFCFRYIYYDLCSTCGAPENVPKTADSLADKSFRNDPASTRNHLEMTGAQFWRKMVSGNHLEMTSLYL